MATSWHAPDGERGECSNRERLFLVVGDAVERFKGVEALEDDGVLIGTTQNLVVKTCSDTVDFLSKTLLRCLERSEDVGRRCAGVEVLPMAPAAA